MHLHIDQKYLGIISLKLGLFKRKSDRLFNFRCPFCGDSESSRTKARGYVYQNKGILVFKCHNCSYSTNMAKLIERVDPALSREYRLEVFREEKGGTNSEPRYLIPKPEFKQAGETRLTNLGLIPVSDLSATHRAVQYLQGRKIPEERYSDLYYAKDMTVCEALNSSYKDRLIADERIVIPFRNMEGKLTGVTGRAMGNSKLRYMTVRINNEPLVYGLDRVDFSKTVYVMEGQFDAMLIPNAIAPGGTDMQRALSYIPGDKAVLVFDNQPRNKQVVDQVQKMATRKIPMVVWPSNWKYKDINESVVDGVDPSEVVALLNTCTHQGLALNLALRDWKKC